MGEIQLTSYCNNVIPLSHSSLVKNPIVAASRCHAKTSMMICRRKLNEGGRLHQYQCTSQHKVWKTQVGPRNELALMEFLTKKVKLWVKQCLEMGLGVTHILGLQTYVFTEPLHSLWPNHLLRSGVLTEPSQALFTGERLLGTYWSRAMDLRSSETVEKKGICNLKKPPNLTHISPTHKQSWINWIFF